MKQWKKFEKQLGKDFEGKLVKASGNQWYAPGDIKSDTYLVEAKQTAKRSYNLKWETLDKIYEEALFSKKVPLMALQIQDKEVIVIFKDDFLQLMNR